MLYDKAPWTTINEGKKDPTFQAFFTTEVRARRLAWPLAAQRTTPDCATESSRKPDDPPNPDYFSRIQAEKVITL